MRDDAEHDQCDDPEREGDAEVAEDIFRAAPFAAEHFAQRRALAARSEQDIGHQAPLPQHGDEVEDDAVWLLRGAHGV